MIRALLFLALFLELSVWSQGQVDFRNDRMFMTPADRLVRDSSGAPLVGESYLAQLYYGPAGATESSLNPVTAAPAGFRTITTDGPGTWIGGMRTLSGFLPGSEVVLQVRVWDGTVAGNYEAAAALNFLGTQHGVSEPFAYIVPPIGPPEFVFYMEGFRGFTLVPEPSVGVGFAVLGVGAMLLWQRRK
jgi:hypothetical protein